VDDIRAQTIQMLHSNFSAALASQQVSFGGALLVWQSDYAERGGDFS
jgi:hypothetical protein